MIPDESAARLLEAVLAATEDGVFVFDTAYRIVMWNGGMERLTGLPAREVRGKHVLSSFPYVLESGEDRLFGEALAGRTVTSKDRPFFVEGTRRTGYYDATYAPWIGADGAVAGVVAFVHDVTQAKRAREQIEESERRFKNMADASPVLLWMSRTDGLCTFFNQTWLDFTGRTLEEEWGVGWSEGVHFEDFQRCMDTYTDAFNRRVSFEMEYRLRRRDGVYRWILDRGAPRSMPDGTFAGFIGSCIDITERKELEGNLRQALRGRDEFLSIASHELRTPITAIQLHLETLLSAVERTELPDESRERITKHATGSLEKTSHLTTMVGKLLDVSRLSEGRLVIQPETFDLGALVTDVVGRLRHPSGSGSTMTVTAEAGLEGRWDRLRIEQIVSNLVSNALKYGAGKPIDVVVAPSPAGVRLTVADRGIGIAPADQPYVFERFTRFVSVRRYGGFGLGLWITREIVRAHGGTISLESRVGEGSTFVVELPTGAVA